jgi:hypothetical protein
MQRTGLLVCSIALSQTNESRRYFLQRDLPIRFHTFTYVWREVILISYKVKLRTKPLFLAMKYR